MQQIPFISSKNRVFHQVNRFILLREQVYFRNIAFFEKGLDLIRLCAVALSPIRILFRSKKVAGTSKNSNISDLLKNRMFQKLVTKVWKINISDRKKQLSGESVMHSDDLWRRSWQKWICLVVRSKLKNLFNFQGSWTGLSAGVVKICSIHAGNHLI